jgi:hypothetical protein
MSDEFSKFGIVVFALVLCAALASVPFGDLITEEGIQVEVVVPDPSPLDVPELAPSEVPEFTPSLVLDLNVSDLNWGELTPGKNQSRGVLVTNRGNVKCELFLRAEKWDPVNASDVLFLSWDAEGSVLAPGKSLSVCLVLDAAAQSVWFSGFSFQVVITAVAVL